MSPLNLKLNFDGSVHPKFPIIKLLLVLLFKIPLAILIGMANNLCTMEIFVAEATALHDDLLAIPNPELQNLIVECDSKTLINAINCKIDIPGRIKFLF